MATKIEAKIEALQKQLAQAKALRNKQLAAERTRQAKEARALDTRQKLLVGAYVLSKSGLNATDYAARNPDFLAWLTRDYDREAFGLSALVPEQQQEEQ